MLAWHIHLSRLLSFIESHYMKKIALHMFRQGRKLPTAPVAALLKAAGQMIFRQILPKIASYAEI